jgi:radical SAM superfamily enzyme YgiQ (UPF0313 family)
MCSYNSPTFLFQPIELISLAAIARNEKIEVSLLDAIAENLTTHEVQEKIKEINPSQIVCLTGFECIEEDIAELKNLKRVFPATQQIVFGHYASVFRKEIMELCDIDFIIHGEPDLIFKDLILYIKNKNSFSEIEGLSYRFEEKIVHNAIAGRIIYPNELPMPAFDLLKNNLYKEPFFPAPYGLIQSARGCPYQCNFCVKSYGTKLTTLTPENIILQLENYIQLFNIKAFRFIDDTFTAVPSRVIEFCKLLISKKLNLKWSCLARPDTLDSEMLGWMKEAGCSRLYIGVESGSQQIIDALHKKFNVEEALKNCQKAKKMGFNLMGFFMVGHPKEKLEDVKKSIQFAIKGGFSFIVVSTLKPYPGTVLFEQYKNELKFSLVPHKNEFLQKEVNLSTINHQQYFMRKYYFHPIIWLRISILAIKNTGNFIQNLFSFLTYLNKKNKNASRKDYI